MEGCGLITTTPIVYFSSVTENTKRFVEKLGFPSKRIPLQWDKDNPMIVDEEYILFCPSYGGGAEDKAVPKQVIKFLNIEQNRNLCKGVVCSGNTNFGKDYLIAGKILSHKLQVPIRYGFELMGTKEDVEKVTKGIKELLEQK